MDVKEYLNLVPVFNGSKPKFMAFLSSILEHPASLGNVAEDIDYAFYIHNAAGKQLDIIGDLIGVDRLLSYVPSSGSREMSDEEYRIAILMTIARNEWDGSQEGAERVYDDIMDGIAKISFYDDGECNVEIGVVGDTRTASIMNSVDVFLVPAGVSKHVTVTSGQIEVTGYSNMQIISEATKIVVPLT